MLGQQCPTKGNVQRGLSWTLLIFLNKHRPVPWSPPWGIIGNSSVEGGRGGFIPVGCSHPSHALSHHILNSWGMWSSLSEVPWVPCTFAASLALISALRCGHLLTDGVVSIPRVMCARFWGDVISYHLLFFRNVQSPFWWADVMKPGMLQAMLREGVLG